METQATGSPRKERTRASRILLGCLGGCALVALVLVSSCVGFVWWLNRPGELIAPGDLRGPDTTAYVEWTLRLEDPGTRALVEDLLATMRELQDAADTPLPPAVSGLLNDMQSRRNERQMRQLFPCVVAWTVVGDATGRDLHLVTASIEKLGNRLVFIDWLMGWFIGRGPEIDTVRYDGETIYLLEKHGTAFFMRRSDFVFATDLDTAKRAVDRLASPDSTGEGVGLERLLARVPADSPLRGAALNRNDEVRRFFELVTADDEQDAIDSVDWERVSGMTLHGGFTEESAFEAEITLMTEGGEWPPEAVEPLRDAIARVLSSDAVPSSVELRLRPDRVELYLEVDDLPGLLRGRVRFDEARSGER
jgi:hypothetical protein